jgi:hypothetical protein
MEITIVQTLCPNASGRDMGDALTGRYTHSVIVVQNQVPADFKETYVCQFNRNYFPITDLIDAFSSIDSDESPCFMRILCFGYAKFTK